jgi:FkbM family methyltransferase
VSLVAGAARWAGLARSIAIYDLKPGQAARLDRLYRNLVGPGDLCLDVGAHLGNRTRSFRRLGARVVAVEAEPWLAARLHRRFAGDPAVSVVAAAVDAVAGIVELRVSRLFPTVTTGSAAFRGAAASAPGFAAVRWNDAVRVPSLPLDRLIDAHGDPAFVKLDVEGMERRALEGLSRPVRALSFEFLPMQRAEAIACLRRLEALAPYRYNVALGETMQLLWDGWLDADGVALWLERLRDGDPSGDIYAVRAAGGR